VYSRSSTWAIVSAADEGDTDLSIAQQNQQGNDNEHKEQYQSKSDWCEGRVFRRFIVYKFKFLSTVRTLVVSGVA